MPRAAIGPDGLTDKQRAFVHKYLETHNATEAYKHAYNAKKMSAASIGREAHKLLNSPQIAPILGAKTEAKIERAENIHEITVDTLTAKLNAALDKAMADPKGASAAVSAVMGLGKLHGLIVDKKDVTTRKDTADQLGDDELAAIARSGRADHPGQESGPGKSDQLH